MQPPHDDLLRKLLNLSDSELVQEVDKDIPSELRDKDQRDDYMVRKTWKTITCWSIRIGFGLIATTLIGFLAVAARYVYLIWNNPQQLNTLLAMTGTFFAGLVVKEAFAKLFSPAKR